MLDMAQRIPAADAGAFKPSGVRPPIPMMQTECLATPFPFQGSVTKRIAANQS